MRPALATFYSLFLILHFILYMVLFFGRVSFSEIEFLRPPALGGFINSFLSFLLKKEEVIVWLQSYM
jgi:hypothetical protein